MKVRYESWGAWVKLEAPPAMVALDREGSRALGLDGSRVWNEPARPSAPIEVHLAVTSRCGAGCEGCYIDARPDGVEPSLETIERRLDGLRDAGVFTVAFGGGEPTTRGDLDTLAKMARARDLTPVLTTSGLGLTDARIERLRGFAQVNVSYDGPDATYASVRGFDGAHAAEAAIQKLAAAGIRVGVNVVLTRDSFPRLRETLERARDMGACEAQLLRYKPAGRAASIDYLARRMTLDQRRQLGPMLRSLARDLCTDDAFHLRIDCALVSFLSADESLANDPDALSRFGVFGCEAAGALAAATVDGRIAPCSFAPASDLPTEDLAEGYAHDAHLTRWRTSAEDPPEPCAGCSLRTVCKGGCKIVSSFISRSMGPDPECPRVEAFRAESRS